MNRMTALREATEMSVDDLAAELGYDPEEVLRWEQGDRIPARGAKRLATFFAVSVEHLRGEA